jgi:TolB protein
VKRIAAVAIAGAALLCTLSVQSVQAQIRGEIIGAGARLIPIAVPALKRTGDMTSDRAARRFIEVLRGDLELSGIFRVIDPAAYIDDPQTSGLTRDTVNFENWRSVGAMTLIRGSVKGTGSDLAVEVRVFDVADHSSSGGRRMSGSTTQTARMAHRMADTVLEYLTGIHGPFDSRLAFVSNRGGHVREIYTYSFDGEVKKVTNHRSITMAPSWHPSAQALLFTSFRSRAPVLYSLDLRTGYDSRLASKLGVNVGGSYSPDGSRVLLARESNGNTDIHELDPSRGKVRPLTTHWAIDVDPGWAPDGRRIVFCSSRSGTPQVYSMSIGGSDLRRLTFDGNYNCSPVWSPDGKHIAFAGQSNGRFQIYVMPAEGGSPRQLTFSGSNEDPTWSPDSRYLAYSGKRGGRRKIYMIDMHGRRERQLTDGSSDDSSPSWSRRLEYRAKRTNLSR